MTIYLVNKIYNDYEGSFLTVLHVFTDRDKAIEKAQMLWPTVNKNEDIYVEEWLDPDTSNVIWEDGS